MTQIKEFCTYWEISDCYNFLKDFTPAFVAVCVGLFASFFAFRQWLVAREKLRLDLFDKRLKVFNSFTKKVASDVGDLVLTQDQYAECLLDMGGMEFLFPNYVLREMSELNDIANQYRDTKLRWKSLEGKDYPEELKEQNEAAISMGCLRSEYDRRSNALPRTVSRIMRFAHITH